MGRKNLLLHALDQIVIDPDLTLARRIEPGRRDAGQLHERDAPRGAHVLLRRGLDRLNPGDVGRDVFEVFVVLVVDEGAAVRAVLVEERDALVDLLTAATVERRREVCGKSKDRIALDDLRRRLADVQPVVDIGLAHLDQRQATEAVRRLEQIADGERDCGQQSRRMHLGRHDIHAFGLYQFGLSGFDVS